MRPILVDLPHSLLPGARPSVGPRFRRRQTTRARRRARSGSWWR